MKKAIITGASSGLGKAIAFDLAKKGFFVILLGRKKGELAKISKTINGSGGKSIFFVFDLRYLEEIDDFVKKYRKIHTILDCLVNNAGVGYYGKVSEIDKGEMEEMLDVNLKSHIYLTNILLPFLRGSKKGSIINISSAMVGKASEGFSVYYSSKAGLEEFSRLLKNEIGKEGIKVTLLKIGAMNTNFSKDIRKKVQPTTSVNRSLSPKQVADFISYILLLPLDTNISEVEIMPH